MVLLTLLALDRRTVRDLVERLGCGSEQVRKYLHILQWCVYPVRMQRAGYGKCFWTCDMYLAFRDHGEQNKAD